MNTRLTIRDLPESEQPLYRIQHQGVEALSNAELIAIVASLTYSDTADSLMAQAGSLKALDAMAPEELTNVENAEIVLSAIQAAFELGRRRAIETAINPQVRSPGDLASLVVPLIGHKEQEHLIVVLLDNHKRVIATEVVYKGTINSAPVRIAEVMRLAVRRNACCLALAHNHPSGNTTPSPDDVLITKNIVEAGELLGIEVLDHLIISRTSFTSLREKGLGFK